MNVGIGLLKEYFYEKRRVALAFSGGVDSSFLAYFSRFCGTDVTAYYVKTEFQQESNLGKVRRFCNEQDIPLKVLERSALGDKNMTSNGPDRCYHCKRMMMNAIKKAAAADGYDAVIDGTNASDPVEGRPGTKALGELAVESPLKFCGITKDMVRKLSKDAGLDTWNLPSDSCLATRVEQGRVITSGDLKRIDRAESLFRCKGLSDFRILINKNGDAKLRVSENDRVKAAAALASVGMDLSDDFASIGLDPEPRK